MSKQTTFILHGGFTPGEALVNDALFSEILRHAPQKAKVLLVYFAKEADRVIKNLNEDLVQFDHNRNGKDISFEVAEIEKFEEQVKRADVVYFHGGKTDPILKALKPFTNLAEILKGKVVAGDSAGANVLCAAFYSMSIGPGEGYGVVLVKVICHYLEENEHKLDHIRPDVELVRLKEYEMKVLQQ